MERLIRFNRGSRPLVTVLNWIMTIAIFVFMGCCLVAAIYSGIEVFG